MAIVDVHTHTPRFEHSVPEEYQTKAANAKWSPHGVRPTVYTWAEFDTAMTPVDRVILFNIAQAPEGNDRVDEPYVLPASQANDEAAAFV